MSKPFKLFLIILSTVILGLVATIASGKYNASDIKDGTIQASLCAGSGIEKDILLQNRLCVPTISSKNGLPISYYNSAYESFFDYARSYKSTGGSVYDVDTFSPFKFTADWMIWSAVSGAFILGVATLRKRRSL